MIWGVTIHVLQQIPGIVFGNAVFGNAVHVLSNKAPLLSVTHRV
jgi:hypothetical protein